MLPLLLTVFTASLLGSLHCAGMCGAFCCIAVSGGRTPTLMQHAAYHGGRLVTYLLLGVAAGSLGALVNIASTLAGLQPLALGLAGGVLVFCGLVEIARLQGWTCFGLLNRWRPPKFWVSVLQRSQQFAVKQSALPRAILIGLLTTLLPCGWLYAFVVTAAGSGGPWQGAAVMLVFWVGTLPVLLSLGTVARKLAGLFGEKLPLVTAAALVIVGLITLSGRFALSPTAHADEVTQQAVEQVDQQESESAAACEVFQPAVPDPHSLPPCCRARLKSEDVPESKE